MDIFVGSANGEIGVWPWEFNYSETVVGVEEDKGLVSMGVSDDLVEVREELAGCEVDDTDDDEIGFGGDLGDEVSCPKDRDRCGELRIDPGGLDESLGFVSAKDEVDTVEF